MLLLKTISRYKFLWVVFVACFHCSNVKAQLPSEAGHPSKLNILILHSYHKGFTWTDDISEGIESVFQANNVYQQAEVYVEYLDSKRYTGAAHIQNYKNYIKEKYQKRKLLMVITSDDDAFLFAIKNRPELFASVPILFCAVNNLPDYQKSLLLTEENFSGLVEGFDLFQTIECALELHPEAQNLYIINDKTPTGIANHNAFEGIKAKLPSSLSYKNIEMFDMDEVKKILEPLPQNSVLLLLTYNLDKDGDYYSYQEAGQLISRATALPVYVVWDFYLGTGVVGGKVTSGINQGKQVAAMAVDLLKGTPITKIPVIWENNNTFKFDHAQLKRFNISAKSLPKGSIVLNKPESVLLKYQKESISILVGFFILLSSVFALLFVNRMKTSAEKRLIANRNKLATILETAKEGFIEFNTQGIITHANVEICQILELDKDSIINHPLDSLLKLYTNDSKSEIYMECFNGKNITVAYEVRTFNMTLRNLIVNYSPIINAENNQVEGAFAIISDITYLKETEKELRAAKEKAEKSDYLKSAFLANMSHEIRTPMNAIIGFSDLLGQDDLAKEQQEFFIETIQRSGQSLLALINDILDLSKIEAGELNVVKNQVNINRMLTNLYSTFKETRKTLSKELIELTVIPLETNVSIETDEFRLQQILGNLISNALKFTQYGLVEFGCTQVSENELEFFVKDTGIGMTEEMKREVFQRFRKDESITNVVYRGAGLGLSISQHLVHLLKGKIWFESEVDIGTNFYFTIQGEIEQSLIE